MTTSTPVRAIKARTRSRSEQGAARRAIEEPTPPVPSSAAATARQSPSRDDRPTNLVPGIGRAETQLVIGFLMTAAIVFTFTVLLPLLLRLVRNF